MEALSATTSSARVSALVSRYAIGATVGCATVFAIVGTPRDIRNVDPNVLFVSTCCSLGAGPIAAWRTRTVCRRLIRVEESIIAGVQPSSWIRPSPIYRSCVTDLAKKYPDWTASLQALYLGVVIPFQTLGFSLTAVMTYAYFDHAIRWPITNRFHFTKDWPKGRVREKGVGEWLTLHIGAVCTYGFVWMLGFIITSPVLLPVGVAAARRGLRAQIRGANVVK